MNAAKLVSWVVGGLIGAAALYALLGGSAPQRMRSNAEVGSRPRVELREPAAAPGAADAGDSAAPAQPAGEPADAAEELQARAAAAAAAAAARLQGSEP